MLKVLIATALALAISASAANAHSGPAAKEATRYMAKTKVPCFRALEDKLCTIASMAKDLDIAPKIFYGPDLAVVFTNYQFDSSGNAVSQMAIVLKNVAGQWKVLGRADETVGENPREVKFAGDTISYVGTVVREGEERAAPTGKARFQLQITPGGVKFVAPRR